MFDDYLTTVLTFLTGLGSGTYVGIASGTAEPFIIPLLTIVLGASVYQAIGTSLIVDCIIGGIAGTIFLLKGRGVITPVIILAITGIVFSVIGSFFSTGTPESSLKWLIAIVLIFFGLVLIRGGTKRNINYVKNNIDLTWLQNHAQLSLFLFGSFFGFMSGFTGMGSSGAMAILLIFVMGYDLHTSIGTSLLMMFFIAAAGGIAHGFQGNFIFQTAMIAGAGAGVGAGCGSLFANRVDEDKLGRIIGVIIVVLGTAFLIDVLI